MAWSCLALPAQLGAASPPATPAPVPPGRDTTVPVGPVQAVSVGGQAVQVAPISRVTLADGRSVVADRIIVGFKPGVSDAEQQAVHRAVAQSGAAGPNPVPLKRVIDNAQYVAVTGAPSLDATIRAYRADPRVAYAEPDYIVTAAEAPNDPQFAAQYGMAQIHAPAAWDVTHGSAAVKIAILDCGIYEAHPDLAGKVTDRQDFTGSLSTPPTNDLCNHGTHVSGIASADTNNGVGVAGVGYNTSLLNYKILDDTGHGTISWVASGIQWAADHGANVINMSLGLTVPTSCAVDTPTLQQAIDYAWSMNVVVVAAAGNDGANEAFSPADCDHVVAVASTDQTGAKSSFSNFGSGVALAAPGSGIVSSVNPNLAENAGQAYASFDGTSMASPHVAGLAGLLWATHWGTSAQAVVARLESTADPIAGTGTNWQYGRINAQTAIGAPAPTVSTINPANVVMGGPGFTLTVTGTNFQPGATVYWNGASRATVYGSSTRLTVAVAAADIAAVGTATITVLNPDGGTAAQGAILTIGSVPPSPPSRPAPNVPTVVPAPASVPVPMGRTAGASPGKQAGPTPASLPTPR